MNRREFLTGGLSVTIVGCGQENEVAQEYTIQQTPQLRTANAVFETGVEGAWTPTLSFAGGGSMTYLAQYGYYRRMGNIVYLFFQIQVNATSNANGAVFVDNLPVSPEAYTEELLPMFWNGTVSSFVNMSASVGLNKLGIAVAENASTTSLGPLLAIHLQTNTRFGGSGFFRVSSAA